MGMTMGRTVPFAICVDVEPDQRVPTPGGPVSWHGFEAMTARLDAARRELAAASGRPPRYTWFVRLDPQVEAVCGSAAWPLVRFGGEIARLRRTGDAIGLHVHATRLEADARGWVIDYGDRSWVERCVRAGFEVFRAHAGHAPGSFRFGDGWMSDAVMDLLDAEGVAVDVTLRPGWRSPARPPTSERTTGAGVDYTTLPAAPYRPSRRDFRRPDPADARRVWVVPETTALPQDGVRYKGRFETVRRLLPGYARRHQVPAGQTLDLGLPASAFTGILDAYLRRADRPLVVCVARANVASDRGLAANLGVNLEGLVRRGARDGLIFDTAEAALDAWCDRRPVASEVSACGRAGS